MTIISTRIVYRSGILLNVTVKADVLRFKNFRIGSEKYVEKSPVYVTRKR